MGLTSSKKISPSDKAFPGYRWTLFSSSRKEGLLCREDSLLLRTERLLACVNWPALLDYAAEKRNGINCKLLPHIEYGANHMIRIVEFADDTRWVARIPMNSEHDCCLEIFMNCEFNTISVLRQQTRIPVPQIHAIEVKRDCSVNAPFMLMDCLEGNGLANMGLNKKIPPEYKQNFLSSLAKIHVQLSAVQLPKIGTIVSMNDDGTYQQGPIPGVGGPFDTATEFFKAWAANITFGISKEKLKAVSGPYAAEVIPSVASFKKSINELACRLSVHDHGPFPLSHGHFGFNKIVVDDKYRVVGIVDWTRAFAGPWEVFGDFPLPLLIVPRAMDPPCLYDEEGSPKNPDLRENYTDQNDYIEAVIQEEIRSGENGSLLSKVLKDSKRQHLATAMWLYREGKAGFYSKVIDEFLS